MPPARKDPELGASYLMMKTREQSKPPPLRHTILQITETLMSCCSILLSEVICIFNKTFFGENVSTKTHWGGIFMSFVNINLALLWHVCFSFAWTFNSRFNQNTCSIYLFAAHAQQPLILMFIHFFPQSN